MAKKAENWMSSEIGTGFQKEVAWLFGDAQIHLLYRVGCAEGSRCADNQLDSSNYFDRTPDMHCTLQK